MLPYSLSMLSAGKSWKKTLLKLLPEAEDYFNHPYPGLYLPDRLDKLTQRKINAGTKNNCTPPAHHFFR